MRPVTKKQWRKVALARRNHVINERSVRDTALLGHLVPWLCRRVRSGSTVVLFDSLPGEVNLAGLTEDRKLADSGVQFGLTRTPDSGFDLTVHPLPAELEQHRFGYRQPIADSPLVADEDIGVVLVPALAFDRAGSRLGFGAGYYDRFLARVPNALKVGIADLVVDEPLPAEDFDIPMTHLATVDGVTSI